MSVGGQPWAQALTEDLEPALDLAGAGPVLTTPTTTHADQQGVLSLRRLIEQHTRWFQGHMTAIRHVPRTRGARTIPHMASIEIILHPLAPRPLVLPWSIVFHASLVVMVHQMIGSGPDAALGGDPTARAEATARWYILSLAPNLAAVTSTACAPLTCPGCDQSSSAISRSPPTTLPT
ncbi:hypothetical protein GCM10010442_34300 [Kitasatospora kifunensis]|uniref:Uncharacterized protein n=1 Tax=Kitasatospora kifunensis TaxID=58351 RepID=A0A7W7VYZ4_KITKI|nr:hypothetical protein [Kitasatospora kifunensis]